MIYGGSGVGKTVFAASAPGPIEIWDFDHKASSIVSHFKRTGQTAKLDTIDVHQFANLEKDKRIPAWEARSLAIEKCVREKQPLPFKTLVLDSLTTFAHYILEDYIWRSQRGIKRNPIDMPAQQDYGLLDKHLTRIITGILALECNIIFIGHEYAEKDEATGVISKKPLMSGKFADKIAIYFEEVYACQQKSDGKRVFLTQPSSGYIARTQRGLAKEVPMEWAEVCK